MSKMGNEFIRQSEAASLDNATEVERLRAQVRRLRMVNAILMGTLEGLEQGLRDGGLVTHEHILDILARFHAEDRD